MDILIEITDQDGELVRRIETKSVDQAIQELGAFERYEARKEALAIDHE
jgi:hypothetical protein